MSLRHPIELAHRVQSVQALSGGRLRLGVGSGSTRASFELLAADYDRRFRMLMSSLDIMRRAWRGESVNGGALSPWPECAFIAKRAATTPHSLMSLSISATGPNYPMALGERKGVAMTGEVVPALLAEEGCLSESEARLFDELSDRGERLGQSLRSDAGDKRDCCPDLS